MRYLYLSIVFAFVLNACSSKSLKREAHRSNSLQNRDVASTNACKQRFDEVDMRAQSKSDFEAKLDPKAKQSESLGWGKRESATVKDFKKQFIRPEYYEMLFQPSKFDLAQLGVFEGTSAREGLSDTLSFFGEMLRSMSEKEIQSQKELIFKIAHQINMGISDFYASFNQTLIAGNIQLKWQIKRQQITVQVENYKKPDMGWGD